MKRGLGENGMERFTKAATLLMNSLFLLGSRISTAGEAVRLPVFFSTLPGRPRHALMLPVVAALVVGSLWLPRPAKSAEAPQATGVGAGLADHFSWDVRVLAFGIVQQPLSSTQNPSNNLLQIPRYVADTEIRPDLRLTLDPLELSAKPRGRVDYSIWDPYTGISP